MPTRSTSPRRRSALLSIATICAISLPATALVAASPSFADEDKFADGKKVSQGAIAGDGSLAQAEGSVELVDGVGATWFLNTNITFSTTSSASGAAYEASFLEPTVASTIDGGTTEMTLDDAFDGYNSLSTFVGPLPPPGPPETLTEAAPSFALSYNQLGEEPTTSCDGRQLVYPDQVNGALTVSRKVFVPADAGYARWTNTVTNTSAESTLATLYIDGNLGSDSRTEVFGSSSGDTASTTADSWVGTFQDFEGNTTSPDPRIGHVLQGNGAASTLVESVFEDEDSEGLNNPYWTYQVTVAPGETKSILNYTVLRGTQAGAAAAAASLASSAPEVCMTPAEANAVENFNGLGTRPTLTLPASVQKPATGPDGAVVTFDASAVDAGNQNVPVTCSPASGSQFPVGVTKVTCTATDRKGKTSTGSFDVTVGPYTPPAAPAVAQCEGEDVTIQAKPGVVTMGTAGKDVILGTSASDTINSLGGDDIICGVGGNDVINAGLGNDTVEAGDGDDNVRGGRGADEVLGGAGDDILRGGRGGDDIDGGAGDDKVRAGGAADKVKGGAGADRIRGGEGNDRLRGNGGKDRVVGLRGDDKVSGGGGDDQLAGNRGDDELTGGAGDDKLRGGPGRDLVDGVVE